MEKLKMHSINKIDENIAKIGEIFPNCITERINENGELEYAVDFDILKQELSPVLVEGNEERYQFTWPDKKKSILLANEPINKTLRPCREESVDFDNTENLYIEGDNLEILKLLQETYLGKIKLIYIDPPYNTGNDLIYEDDFKKTVEEYMENSNQYDVYGNRLVKNFESNGRFHTDWLNMIYPRLKLSKNLMSENGVIFISIDDNELENLKKICDEIFGEDNFINIISLNLKNVAGASGGGEDKRLKKNCEYILIYAKNYNEINSFNGPYVFTEISDLIQTYLEEGRSWKYTSVLIDPGRKEYIGSTTDGDGNEIKVFARKNFKTLSVKQIAKNENIELKEAYKKYGVYVYRTTNSQSSIRRRIINFRKENKVEDTLLSIEYTPKTGKYKGQRYEQFYKDEECNLFVWLRDTSEEINGELYKRDLQGTLWDFAGETKNLTHEGSIPFPNGKKPVKLIKQIVSMVTEPDDYILDFFSGSATTAHAVMLQNEEDQGNRKFIMIQFPESIKEESELKKLGYKNICEVGKNRIRKSALKLREGNELRTQNIDMGFRVLKCDSSNMKDVYYSPNEFNLNLLDSVINNIKEERTSEDLLFQVMLDLGILLSSKIEESQIEGKKVFNVENGFLIACFDDNLTEKTIIEIAKMRPYYFVIRDSGMANDSVATNFEQIFAIYSPNTERRVL